MDDSLGFNVFNTDANREQSTTGLNGQFIHSQLLINCLLHMQSKDNEKDELIAYCQQKYQDHADDLKILQEFREHYRSDRAIWWYTRESFLYRELNQALRTQSIDLLLMFRFFIRDLHEQLEQNRCSSPMRVFRGQLMSTDELQQLKKSIGQLISMNSFFSTSSNRRLASSFLFASNLTKDTQRVLFEIDADPTLPGTRPCANITPFSYFPGEDEILFMLGAVFRLKSIQNDEKGIHILRMDLCHEIDHNLQATFDCLKRQYGNGETNLHSFAFALAQMGKIEEAERCFLRVLKENPVEIEDVAACYHNLGDLWNEKSDYEMSLKWHNKALELMQRILSPHDYRIGVSYNSIAVVYSKMGDLTRALEYYQKASDIWVVSFGFDHINIALLLSNMAGILRLKEDYMKAIELLQRALIIREKHLPTNHPQISDTHNNLGLIYLQLEQYDQALKHATTSLEMKQKCLPKYHPDIGSTLTSIALICDKQGQSQQALDYLQQAKSIFAQTLQPNHPTIVVVEKMIDEVSEKLK